MPTHLTVWIDHKEARVLHVDDDGREDTTVKAPGRVHHKHPKGPEGAKEHPDDAKRFFHDVARSLEGTDEILLVGPSSAKLEFFRYVHAHDPALEARIFGIETVDHPTDGQLVAHAKKYFKHEDQLR